MKADEFRRIALTMSGVSEGAHRNHPDFRAAGRIFATLGYPGGDWGMVKLTPEQQAVLVAAEPAIFQPVVGAWGRRGSTQVRLDALDRATAISALAMAWANVASERRGSRSPVSRGSTRP